MAAAAVCKTTESPWETYYSKNAVALLKPHLTKWEFSAYHNGTTKIMLGRDVQKPSSAAAAKVVTYSITIICVISDKLNKAYTGKNFPIQNQAVFVYPQDKNNEAKLKTALTTYAAFCEAQDVMSKSPSQANFDKMKGFLQAL